MFKKPIFFLFLISSVALTSCSKYQKLLKSADNEAKYEAAIDYYEKGDYYRALQLFDPLITVYRGTKKAENLYYYYANCYYKQQDYILASYYFKRFVKNFPNSDRAEECVYLSAYCTYLDSPKYNLDQTNTYEAIKELQLFINMYPDSKLIDDCNELMDKLRNKLETKAFEIAKLYYKMGDYKASIFSFENIIKDFPDTQYKEEILFYIVRSYYKYAINSIKSKKKERYSFTVESYKNFLTIFPESDFMREASNIYENALEELNN